MRKNFVWSLSGASQARMIPAFAGRRAGVPRLGKKSLSGSNTKKIRIISNEN